MEFVSYGFGVDISLQEARSVAESSEGPTASQSDRTGRNPGLTRLVRRSSAMSGGTAFFSLSVSACVNVLALLYLAYQKNEHAVFYQELTFQ